MAEDKKPVEDDSEPETVDEESTETTEEPESTDPVNDSEQTEAERADTKEPVEGIIASKRTWKERLKPREFALWAREHKKKSIPLGIVVLLLLLLAVPVTRYKLVGIVLKKDYQLSVVDSKTGKPVSSAMVNLGGKTAKTDAKGVAKLHVSVGKYDATITKKYYKTTDQSVTVPIGKQKSVDKVSFAATGRQVIVTVHNTIGGGPESGVTVSASGTEAKTDSKGEATIVLPSDKGSVSATISKSGFNSKSATITIVDGWSAKNIVFVTPAGKLYFLSDASGKIDVIKSNLDGSNRQTVLAGTGYEDDSDTVLLASRDWKYLALKSIRDNSRLPKMYLINTADDKLTTMDSGNAYFTPDGWADDTFVYTVQRIGYQPWQPNAAALKSFNAASGKLTTLDQTGADGNVNSGSDTATENYAGVFLENDTVVFAKTWYGSDYRLQSKSASLTSIKADGSARKTIKNFPYPADHAPFQLEVSAYEPQSIYVRTVTNYDNVAYFEYEDGKFSGTNITDSTFYKPYPTYLLSPDGTKTLWVQLEDGQNVLYIGDADGENGKKIDSLDSGAAYGWYTNNYALYSLSSSKLYIESSAGGQATKVTDYHKPQQDFSGYGGGYGGF